MPPAICSRLSIAGSPKVSRHTTSKPLGCCWRNFAPKRSSHHFDRYQRAQVVQARDDQKARIATRCNIDRNGCRNCEISLLLRFQSELRRTELQKRTRNSTGSTAEQI